jgi:hypothetical protein
MGSIHNPKNGESVGSTCYAAAVIYAAMIAFCGCQVSGLVWDFGIGMGDRRAESMVVVCVFCRLGCIRGRRGEVILLFEEMWEVKWRGGGGGSGSGNESACVVDDGLGA